VQGSGGESLELQKQHGCGDQDVNVVQDSGQNVSL
jgi:hypothetical protein